MYIIYIGNIYRTSSLGKFTVPYFSSANSAKAALDHFVKHLAREEGHRGIRANLVAPGCNISEDLVHFAGQDPNTKEG